MYINANNGTTYINDTNDTNDNNDNNEDNNGNDSYNHILWGKTTIVSCRFSHLWCHQTWIAVKSL